MDRRTNVTYGQLAKVLRAFGFSRRVIDENGKGVRYDHKLSGAMIEFPLLPDAERVYDHHLVAVRMTLDNFGVAEPSVFEARLQKAG